MSSAMSDCAMVGGRGRGLKAAAPGTDGATGRTREAGTCKVDGGGCRAPWATGGGGGVGSRWGGGGGMGMPRAARFAMIAWSSTEYWAAGTCV
jgi:hypothetical protein